MHEMAILSLFSIYDEIAESVRRHGLTVWPFADIDELRTLLREHRIDMVLDVNYHHLFHEEAVARDIAYAMWSIDSGMAAMLAKSPVPFRPEDKLFFFNHDDVEATGKFHGQVWYLPLSAGDNFILPPRQDDFNADIAVVMQSYARTAREAEAGLAAMAAQETDPDRLGRIALAGELGKLAVEQHLDIFDSNRIVELLQQDIEDCGVNPFVGNIADHTGFLRGMGQILSARQRENCLSVIASTGAKVVLYGDGYWRQIAEKYPNVTFYGMADYAALPEIYNRARIGINLTQVQNLDSIPQRIYHLLAAGTLAMSNGAVLLAETFSPDEHLATFADTQGLRSQLWRYLQDEPLRFRVASHGHREFLAAHQMTDRLELLLRQCNIFPPETQKN